MFNPLKLKFYNYETGKSYPYWFGMGILLLLFLCFLALIWSFILMCHEIGDKLQDETKDKKYQAYSSSISPKIISGSHVYSGDGIPVSVVSDTYFAAFIKQKDTPNNV